MISSEEYRNGHAFVWCNEAVAYEVVPPNAGNAVHAEESLLQGASSKSLDPNLRSARLAKSLIAVFAYTSALPLR